MWRHIKGTLSRPWPYVYIVTALPTTIHVDWEIFTRKNIHLVNIHIVLFSSPQHTGSVALFLIFDVEKY